MNFNPSPLRYPGGKARISGYFSDVLDTNSLQGGEYAEPYAGGAGVALTLLFQGKVSRVHLNDLNYPLYCFWLSVLNEPDALKNAILSCDITVDAWKIHRARLSDVSSHSTLDIGFSFLFLNRTNRSGIINGGMIGGYAQEGKYKIDCRFNRQSLVEKINRIYHKRGCINLYNMDAKDFMEEVIENLPTKSLVYIDPPYFNKGQRLYDNAYKSGDHEALSSVIKSLPNYWVVSYDNVPDIRRYYGDHRQLEYSLGYSAANKYQGKELMVYSEGLLLPEPNTPIKLK